MTNPLKLSAMIEDLVDGTQITWPAVTASSLLFTPGDWILRNRGGQLSYTASDSSLTVTFGSYLNGTTVTGTGSGGNGTSTPYYDGPWAVIHPSAINLKDDIFHGNIEWAGRIDYNQDINGEYPVTLFSGDSSIASWHLPPNVVPPKAIHGSHSSQGHFTGGTAIADFVTSVQGTFLRFYLSDPSASLLFQTHDGAGDMGAQAGAGATLSGIDGSYTILRASSTLATGQTGYPTRSPIYTDNVTGSVHPQNTWPTLNPADSMIGFCRLFPGASTNPTVPINGSLTANTTYEYRFCYYKTLILDAKVNGVTILDAASQTIETPLSPPTQATTDSTHKKIQFTIPAIPSGWSGFRVYMEVPTDGLDPYQLIAATDYTSVTNGDGTITVTVTQFTSNHRTPSYGFSAWSSGTLLLQDVRAIGVSMEKWAHMYHKNTLTDPLGTFGIWKVAPYRDSEAQPIPADLPPASVAAPHLATTNQPSANAFLARNAANTANTWVNGGGSSGLTGGGVTVSVDANGHLVSSGGSPPTFVTAFPSTYCSSGAIIAGSNDVRGSFNVISNGTTIPVAGVLLQINFAHTFTSTPRVVVMPLTGVTPNMNFEVIATTSGFIIRPTTAFTPASGNGLSFIYHIIG